MESRSGVGLAVALVAGFALASLGRPERAFAQQAGGAQMFAVTAPGNGGAGSNVLFVIDPESRRLLVYEHRSGAKLELVTVRDMQYELEFQMWPDAGPRVSTPSVRDMHEKVEELREQQQQQQRQPPGG